MDWFVYTKYILIIAGPRWASWNLGVFLCIRCAGIHRNLGVHISKVKSVNLDSWTPEQVVSLQQMGNSRARAVYEANLPDSFRRPQNDTSLESFVRAKYEHKKYIAREWVPPVIPKVDWEKEIDDEIERQKRKKKAQAAANAADKKQIKIAEVPQIPKPKNASPKPARINNETKNTQDLLGLQNGDEFTGFLSAPPNVTPKTEQSKKKAEDVIRPTVDAAAAAKAEEENFFNQPAPTEKEKTKLTKDSILALYGSAPQNPAQQVMFSSFPQQPFSAQGFPPFQGPQQPFSNLQNGLNLNQFPQPTGTTNQFQFQQQGFLPQMPQGQFMQYPVQGVQNQFAGLPQFPPGAAPQQQFAFGNTTAFPQQPQNPFFGAPQPGALQQQFAGMTLGSAGAKPPGPAVATNLWQ